MRNTNRVEPRNTNEVPAGKYDAALKNFLDALGVEGDTPFEVVVTRQGVVVKHAKYTPQESGVMSGDLWTDVIERGGSE